MGLVQFFLILLYSVTLPPKLSLKVPPENAVEGRQISLYITVVYDPREKVDESSFQLDNQPVQVERVQAERVAPKELFHGSDDEGIAVNRYRVRLPARAAGLYSIGPVTARVGGAEYTSDTITVAVQGAVENDDLRLEAKVQAPPAIYVGQLVEFMYKIIYKNPTQLFKEELPLLSTEGFRTEGSPEVENGMEEGFSVQTIRQRAIAERVGKVDVKGSLIEGMDVEENHAVPPLRRAVTAPVSLTVLPFPEQDKPDSFTGAIGSFVWRSSLPAGDTVAIGEPITIEYIVSGRGELQTVHFPSFAALPGLKESFWTETTPPVGEEVEGTKKFKLTLRPKRLGMVDVPGFAFASFDPVSMKYLTSIVSPLSLTVTGSKEEEKASQERAPTFGVVLAPPFDLDEQNAVAKHLPFWWIPLAALCALLVGFIEKKAAQYCVQKKSVVRSQDLFYKAIMNRSNREKGLRLLEEAFYLRLFEVGMTQKIEEAPQELPSEGLGGEVRGLLEAIEQERFLRSQTSAAQDIFDSATLLYHRLKELPKVTR